MANYLDAGAAAEAGAADAGSGTAGAAVGDGAATVAGATCAVVPLLAVAIGNSGTIRSATMLMILISGLTAGPAVSL